jgi:hypothetical protein
MAQRRNLKLYKMIDLVASSILQIDVKLLRDARRCRRSDAQNCALRAVRSYSEQDKRTHAITTLDYFGSGAHYSKSCRAIADITRYPACWHRVLSYTLALQTQNLTTQLKLSPFEPTTFHHAEKCSGLMKRADLAQRHQDPLQAIVWLD